MIKIITVGNIKEKYLKDAIEEYKKISEQFADYQVQTPVIYPDGDIFYNELDITIISVEKDDIYYTIDGSDPIENGTLYQNSKGICFESSGLYLVRAVCKNEMNVY